MSAPRKQRAGCIRNGRVVWPVAGVPRPVGWRAGSWEWTLRFGVMGQRVYVPAPVDEWFARGGKPAAAPEAAA